MSESTPEKKKSNKGLIAIIIILLLGMAGMGYVLMDKSNTITDMDAERERILFDLEEAKSNIGSLESSNDSMDAYIVTREQRLQSMIDSVRDAKAVSDRTLQRWRNEAYSLRRQINDLEAQVDSINKAYVSLAVENEQNKMDLAQEVVKNEELSTENRELETEVAIGSQLQLTSIYAGAYKVYSSGEEDETSRARRAERVKTCITIGANPIAKKGERQFYMRVLTPGLKVLTAERDSTTGSNTFMVQGNELFYSASKSVWFENEAANVCLTVDREEFEKGTYTVEIYTEGAKVGEGRFVLD